MSRLKDEYGLLPKQKVFCEEYIIDSNASAAAIRAGYSVKGVSVTASKLLAKTNVSAYIDILKAERSKRTGITADRVLNEMAKIAFADITDIINANDATIKDSAKGVDTAAIASIKVKTIPTKDGPIVEREFKMHDKTKNLELLGKNLGILTDKIDMTGDITINIDLEDDGK